jgi:hypothetical protein
LVTCNQVTGGVVIFDDAIVLNSLTRVFITFYCNAISLYCHLVLRGEVQLLVSVCRYVLSTLNEEYILLCVDTCYVENLTTYVSILICPI